MSRLFLIFCLLLLVLAFEWLFSGVAVFILLFPGSALIVYVASGEHNRR